MFYKEPILRVYASRLLKEKVNSLRNDVKKCLSLCKEDKLQPATFTALLACFSTIDFLSALYFGNASSKSSTSNQVEVLLSKYFPYTKKKRDLLFIIYRHKLVHLFQPGHLVEYKGENYSWIIHERAKKAHLVITKQNRTINPAPSISLRLDYLFSISIYTFMGEIINAAQKYSNDLMKEDSLKKNFDRALNDIFSIK